MDKDIMKYFMGKVIKINRGGSESRVGKLMDAGGDFITLLTEDDGVVYYNTQHIKSITDNMKGEMEINVEVPKEFEFKKADHFHNLLDALKFQWVGINRGGPEKLEGVLSEVHQDYVTIINKEEIVRVAMFHIKNISYGLKIEKAEEEKSYNQKVNQSRNSDRQSRNSEKQSVKKSSNSENQTVYKSSKSESDKKQSRQRVVKYSKNNEDEMTAVNQTEVTKQKKKKSTDEDISLTELLSTMENYLQKVSKTKLE